MVIHHFNIIVYQIQVQYLTNQNLNIAFTGVWKLKFHKDYITLASSKCFTKRQLFGGAGV